MSGSMPWAERVVTAHGDGWQALGRLHVGHGGGVGRVAGARLMSSGLDSPAYNNADITDPAEVDVTELCAWYAARGVPWGVRVPANATWDVGRHLFRKELSGLEPGRFAPAPEVPGLQVVVATEADLDAVAGVDVAAFGGDLEQARDWLGPLVTATSGVRVLLARRQGLPIGTAYLVQSDDEAGSAGYLGGVGVVPAARRRGVAGDLSSRLVAWALAEEATLVHCHPENGEAARVYERLGFERSAAFDVYVDLA